jgi:AraC family transcriptional regulator, mar-sox-rob regulon activator
MNMHGFVFDLCKWIDVHLHDEMNADIISARSGYSKWYLQRMFRNVTGMGLTKYVRYRRLSEAIAELWYSDDPISDIAARYQYSSQQAFTRALKDYSGKSPREVRIAHELECGLLLPPFKKEKKLLHESRFIFLPQVKLSGVRHSYHCEFSKIEQFNMDVRTGFLTHHFRNDTYLPARIYGVSHFFSNRGIPGQIFLSYTTACDCDEECISSRKVPVFLPGGCYLQFSYVGEKCDMQEFILDVNRVLLPRLKIVRRRGPDIEAFILNEAESTFWQSNVISLDYLVPVLDWENKCGGELSYL